MSQYSWKNSRNRVSSPSESVRLIIEKWSIAERERDPKFLNQEPSAAGTDLSVSVGSQKLSQQLDRRLPTCAVSPMSFPGSVPLFTRLFPMVPEHLHIEMATIAAAQVATIFSVY